MTLTELKYITALAQEKHFGLAAKACFVSQPTLSIGIKKLEEELGVMLFERDKNEVRLTKIGEKMVAQAQKILEETTKFKDLASTSQNQLAGTLKIGAIYTIGPYLLPKLIPVLRKLAPEMPLIVEEDYTANLRDKLNNGKLDIIFISLPFTETSILTKTIYDESFVVLLPIDHRLSSKTKITPAMLQDENILLLGEGHCFREQVIDYCPQCIEQSSETVGIKPSSVAGSSLETIRMMVASGLGITVLPELAADMSHINKKVLVTKPFQSPSPKRRIAMAWRCSFTRPKVIDVFSKAISQLTL